MRMECVCRWWREAWERQKAALLRCMASVFLAGLACHAAGIFGGLSFYDDVTCTYDVGTTHIFGRFTLALLGKLTRLPFGGSNYSLPWFNALVSFLLLGIFAWMCVRLLGLSAAWQQVLVSGILVAFPVVTSLFAYWFTAPYYMLALPLCGAAACCCTLRGDLAFREGPAARRRRLLCALAGMIITALMIGIYQAYLPVLLTLEVLILIRDEVGPEKYAVTAGPAAGSGEKTADEKETAAACGAASDGRPVSQADRIQLRRWGYALGGTVLGFAGYLVLMKISLTLTGKELYAYRGLETLGSGGSSYLTRILWAYRIFFDPGSFEELRNSTDYLMFMWSMEAVYYVLLVLGIALAAIGAVALFRRSRSALVRYLILTLLFPLTVNFIFVMTDFDVYSLMLYAQVFVFLYPLMMGEALLGKQGGHLREEMSGCGIKAAAKRSDEGRETSAAERGKRLVHWGAFPAAAGRLFYAAAAVLSGYAVIFYCRYDNLCYYKASRMQDAAITYDEILIERIQQAEGYDPALPVCFVDGLEKDVTGWTVDEELAGAEITPYGGLEIINEYSWVSFMRIHCGYAPTVIEDYGQYDSYIEEEEMPVYPAEDSIRVVDGVVVVNF